MTKTLRIMNDKPYVERAYAGPMRYAVYNKNSGFVVAILMGRDLADMLVLALSNNPYRDSYAVGEVYEWDVDGII